jgi:hypothetical protein
MTTRTCAAGILLAALALCGCATTNNPPAKTARAPSPCLRPTASRIPDADCAASGRSYSQTDLNQTGKTTASDALALVDPTVTAGH